MDMILLDKYTFMPGGGGGNDDPPDPPK